MGLVLRLVLRLPALIFVALACAVYGLGGELTSMLKLHNEEIVQAASKPPPEMVDFSGDTRLPEGEVALRAKVDPEIVDFYFYEQKGVTTDYEYFYYLRGLDDDGASQTLPATIIFELQDLDLLEAWFERVAVDGDAEDQIVELRGIASSTDWLSSEASAILQAHGAQPSEQFIYIRPFLKGRDAFFEEQVIDLNQIEYVKWAVTAGLLLCAIWRIFSGRNSKKAAAEPVAPNAKQAVATATAVVGVVGDEEEEVDDVDESQAAGSFGVAFGIAKILWRLFGRKKVQEQPETPVLTDPSSQPVPAEATNLQSAFDRNETPIYSPPREEYLPEDIIEEIYATAAQRLRNQTQG